MSESSGKSSGRQGSFRVPGCLQFAHHLEVVSCRAPNVDLGLEFERAAIGRLATSKACRNLVNLFFQTEQARKLSEKTPGTPEPEIRRVGVVGAGAMGAGIAQLATVKGFTVVVQELNDAALAAGLQRIQALFQKAVAEAHITQ